MCTDGNKIVSVLRIIISGQSRQFTYIICHNATNFVEFIRGGRNGQDRSLRGAVGAA